MTHCRDAGMLLTRLRQRHYNTQHDYRCHAPDIVPNTKTINTRAYPLYAYMKNKTKGK